jgi:hypothetical protein
MRGSGHSDSDERAVWVGGQGASLKTPRKASRPPCSVGDARDVSERSERPRPIHSCMHALGGRWAGWVGWGGDWRDPECMEKVVIAVVVTPHSLSNQPPQRLDLERASGQCPLPNQASVLWSRTNTRQVEREDQAHCWNAGQHD